MVIRPPTQPQAKGHIMIALENCEKCGKQAVDDRMACKGCLDIKHRLCPDCYDNYDSNRNE